MWCLTVLTFNTVNNHITSHSASTSMQTTRNKGTDCIEAESG